MDIDNILLAHAETKMTTVLWGSSGFGKSSKIKAFAKKYGFDVIEKRTCYIDPLSVVLPHKNEEKKVVDFWPANWLDLLVKTTKPTILFLDEFNNPSCPQTFHLFKELLLDRSVDGIKVSDSVLIVGACNLPEEDSGVVEVPDSVMKRITNLIWAPEVAEVAVNMRTKIGKAIVTNSPKSVRSPGVANLDSLTNSPRQIDDCVELWLTKKLTESDLRTVCVGRCGIESGASICEQILLESQKVARVLPSVVNEKTFEQILKCEKNGMVIEVSSLLLSSAEDESGRRNVADYLVLHGGPEICRSMNQHGFRFSYTKAPCDIPGLSIGAAGLDWAFLAMKAGKITPSASKS